MALSGCDFHPPDHETFRQLSIACNGNVTMIAEMLNVTKVTIYRYFKKDPKAKDIIDEVRGYNTFTDLDLAEHVIRSNMINQKRNPSVAQRAAEFTLDYKGSERGWQKNAHEAQKSPNQEEIDYKQKWYESLFENQKLKEQLNDAKSKTGQEL